MTEMVLEQKFPDSQTNALSKIPALFSSVPQLLLCQVPMNKKTLWWAESRDPYSTPRLTSPWTSDFSSVKWKDRKHMIAKILTSNSILWAH